jgi:hypothetical protein
MGHKNDYTVIAFFPDGSAKKWTYVHTLNGFKFFLSKNHSEWQYMNVYDRRAGAFLKRFERGQFVPAFL